MKNNLTIIPELSPETYINPATSLTAFEKEDLHFLEQNKQTIAKVYKHTWQWRTDAQKRSIVSDFFYPTAHGKFHQAILEQKVQLDQALELARNYENAKLDREMMEIELEELEAKVKKLENIKNTTAYKKAVINLKKKEIALSFKDYELANIKNSMLYRMKEVKGWQVIEDKLIETMKQNGMNEEQIWNKETGEVYTNFFGFLNMYLGVGQSTDSAEVNNLTSLALHGIKEEIESGIIQNLIPLCNADQKAAITKLGYGNLIEQFSKK
jgi:hypothetical protein